MCRKKKIKCDGKMPACTHCINYKTDCIFTQVEKKRQPPKGYATLRDRRRDAMLTVAAQSTSRALKTASPAWSR